MVRQVDAIYEDGVFKPVSPVQCVEHERVRISYGPVEAPSFSADDQRSNREDALRELMEHLKKSAFTSVGPYPSREELWGERSRKFE